MDIFNKKLAENPLKSRRDAVRLLLDLCRPLRPFYNEECSLLHVGSSGVHYGEKSARMEGWARVLWGLGPLFGGDNSSLPEDMQAEIKEWEALYVRGLVNGTDPESTGYWGDLFDYDQKMVETAAIDVALSLAPDVLWDPLSKKEKQNVYTWLNQINDYGVHPNNWRFFRILTNMVFGRLGLPVNEERLRDDFAVIEHCYKGNGWYFDGRPVQMDYYIPFAMHYYSLIWSALSADGDPAYKTELQNRSAAFAKDFVQWFADDGAEVPFGRSLTYRFAHSAFFSALALAEKEALPWGVVRHTVLSNLHHWMQYPITDATGILTIGYQYPNLFMSERYNASGSPYWSFKTFLFLALPENHPFWQAREETTEHTLLSAQKEPGMLVGEENGHVTLYPVGQHCMNHGAIEAKYEKFVYSNRFGFSVSRGTSLDAGAFDSVLAASPKGWDLYRARYGVTSFSMTEESNVSEYDLLPGVSVKTQIIPCGADWHVRIHQITAETEIDLADGGFALPVEEPFTCRMGREDGKQLGKAVVQDEQSVKAILPWGGAGIFLVKADFDVVPKMINAAPNTNLMAPLTAIPTLTGTLTPGKHVLVDAVFGSIENPEESFVHMPKVTMSGDHVTVGYHGKSVTVEL